MDFTSGRSKRVPVSIAAGATGLSGPIDLEGLFITGVIMPGAWTTANLTFQASESLDGTYVNVYDDGGTEVSVQVAASRAVPFAAAKDKLAPFRFIKIRSGTSGTPVDQTTARALVIVGKA